MAPRDEKPPGLVRSLALISTGVIITLVVQSLLRPNAASRAPAVTAESRYCSEQAGRISQLEDTLRQLRARALQQQAAPAGATSLAVSVAAAPPPPTTPLQRWSWTGLVMNTMRPFDRLNGGITLRGLRLAEQKCKISTWCHRAQVIGGRLYITDLRAIFFDRHYAAARVMPLLLALKRFPVPDLDAVFSGTDYPIMEIPRDGAHMERMYGKGQGIPPVFSPTANTVSHDIPWPDFSFFPPLPNPACGKGCNHPLKTPRWQLAHKDLLALGRKLTFDEKIDRAVFTGNMKTSPNRRYIFNQAEHHPEVRGWRARRRIWSLHRLCRPSALLVSHIRTRARARNHTRTHTPLHIHRLTLFSMRGSCSSSTRSTSRSRRPHVLRSTSRM